MVVAGHTVGHHVQHILQPGLALLFGNAGRNEQQQADVALGNGREEAAAAAHRLVKQIVQLLPVGLAQGLAAVLPGQQGGHRPGRERQVVHVAVGLKAGRGRLADEQRVHDLALHDRHDPVEQLVHLPVALAGLLGGTDLAAGFADGLHRVLPLAGLEQVGVHLQAQRLLHVVKFIVGGVNDKAGLAAPGTQQVHRLNAAHAGHVHVHNGNVRLQFLHQRHQLNAVGGVLHDLNFRKFLADQQMKRLPGDLFIIRDQQAVLFHSGAPFSLLV